MKPHKKILIKKLVKEKKQQKIRINLDKKIT
jgi:hypothetical protein